MQKGDERSTSHAKRPGCEFEYSLSVGGKYYYDTLTNDLIASFAKKRRELQIVHYQIFMYEI